LSCSPEDAIPSLSIVFNASASAASVRKDSFQTAEFPKFIDYLQSPRGFSVLVDLDLDRRPIA
jgi:hypothetical protein